MSNLAPAQDPESLLDDYLQHAVHRACRGWLSAHADDISQVARLRLLNRRRASPATPLTRAYVHRAARNAVNDVARRHRRRDALWTVHQRVAAPTGVPLDPERAVLDREFASVLRAQLERLPPARRDAVLQYLEGHGISEIAERSGCPRKRIENLVYRGLATLRTALAARGLTPGPSSSPTDG